MPLRARMLIVTVALFVVGLGGANFATYHFLSSFLVDRVDDHLRAATRPAEARLTRAGPLHRGEHGLSLPDGSYAALVDERGRVQREVRFDSGRDAARPKIPTALIRSQARGAKPTLTTTPALSGRIEYRLIVKGLGDAGAVVVAMLKGAEILIRACAGRSVRSGGALLPDARGCSEIRASVRRGLIGCRAGDGERGASSPAGGAAQDGEAAVAAA